MYRAEDGPRGTCARCNAPVDKTRAMVGAEGLLCASCSANDVYLPEFPTRVCAKCKTPTATVSNIRDVTTTTRHAPGIKTTVSWGLAARYACSRCTETFVIRPKLPAGFSIGGGAVFLAIGAAMWSGKNSPFSLTVGVLLGAGLAMLVWGVVSILPRFSHPVAPID